MLSQMRIIYINGRLLYMDHLIPYGREELSDFRLSFLMTILINPPSCSSQPKYSIQTYIMMAKYALIVIEVLFSPTK
jgi:hypothetical protein